METTFNRSWCTMRDMGERGATLSVFSNLSSSDSADSFLQSIQLQSVRTVGMSNRPLPMFCPSGTWGIRYSEGSEGNGKIKREGWGQGLLE